MRTWSLAAIGVIAASSITCGGDRPAPSTPPAMPQAAPPPEDPSALDRAEAAVTAPMQHHFADTRSIEQALVAGELALAHRAAQHLVEERPEAYPQDWAPFLFEQREAAEAVARAERLPEAAAAAGRLAASCGRCHAALEGGPEVPDPTEPPACVDEATTMRGHEWAVEQMWWGIVTPSDEAWDRGTRRLVATARCLPDMAPHGLDPKAIASVHARLQRLADEAAGAVVEQRPDLYGRYLGTCVTCHAPGR